MTRNQNISQHSSRDGTVSNRKQEERALREAYRREKKIESYLADDENFPTFAIQLRKLGLELRDIPGDGNCLFRALGDQLEGHSRNHFHHRQEVVKYMLEHRKDFEPFVEDDVPFDVHISNLKKLGTHAGNDAIVAFAKMHNVNVMIHQISGKPLLIQGPLNNHCARQLHIAYHNGDHYSSIRHINDNTETPANIHLQDSSDCTIDPKAKTTTVENSGVVKAKRTIEQLESEVVAATGCQDLQQVQDVLMDCDFDVDAAIAIMLQQMDLNNGALDDTASILSHQTSVDSGIWTVNGNETYAYGLDSDGDLQCGKGHKMHIREDSLGGSSGYSSLGSNRGGGARPKLNMPQTNTSQQFMARKPKEQKKMEKKKRAEVRHRQRILGMDPHQQLQQQMQQDGVKVIFHAGHVTKI